MLLRSWCNSIYHDYGAELTLELILLHHPLLAFLPLSHDLASVGHHDLQIKAFDKDNISDTR